MLNVSIETEGFETFIDKLQRLIDGDFVGFGFSKAVEEIRQVVIDGTPVGDPETDEHPGLMKRSWGEPQYRRTFNNNWSATVTNSVDYGMASNYGHWQEPGQYVPAIGKRLVHYWVPGTYALERSLDEAEYRISPIIQQELMRTWYDETDKGTVRQQYYDRPGKELNEWSQYGE